MSGPRRVIERLLTEYAWAVDTKEWDRLDAVFTPDAALDFRPVGGRAGTYADVKPWLERRMARYEALHHQLGNVRIDVSGEMARALSYVRATHGHRVDGELVFFELGGVYEDEACEIGGVWRLTRRTLHHRFTTGTLPSR